MYDYVVLLQAISSKELQALANSHIYFYISLNRVQHFMGY